MSSSHSREICWGNIFLCDTTISVSRPRTLTDQTWKSQAILESCIISESFSRLVPAHFELQPIAMMLEHYLWHHWVCLVWESFMTSSFSISSNSSLCFCTGHCFGIIWQRFSLACKQLHIYICIYIYRYIRLLSSSNSINICSNHFHLSFFYLNIAIQ